MWNLHVITPWTVILIPAYNNNEQTVTFILVMGQLVLTDVYPVAFLFLCSICGTHWGEILWYLNISNIVSKLETMKLTFNSLNNSLFVIHYVTHTLSKFILYTTNEGTLHFVAWQLWRALECGLSHNLILPQLKSIIQCLTVLTSTVCFL